MDLNPALQTLRPYLLEDLQYRHIGDFLVKKGILSQKEDYEIFQLVGKAKITKLLNIISSRDGATRELINALKQPTTVRIYKDLIQKLESASTPTSPVTPGPGEGKTYVFPDTNGRIGNVKPDKIIERRHFNELVKILKRDASKWKAFYEALGVDPVEMFSNSQKLLKNTIQPSEAFRDVLDSWKENSGRDCTFGVLDNVLRSLDWEDAADDIEERYWD
ncbi:uncharacterized protein LOC110847375 [Folsomia candida]|uniref:uncharacterized protein LOC110847375 n=1 Tax=Folsomia candida TaxID=158441 RepID=UPI000B8FE509|nr:uncharacterized protein LOC110847375 [Folsomia candida]